jgi:hypothetical protein
MTPIAAISSEGADPRHRGVICDVVVERLGYPQITLVGNSIRILEYGNHFEPGDELCIYGPQLIIASIGAFAAGDYTLTVDLVYDHPVFGPTILNIGTVSFTVAAPPVSASVPVPASTLLSTLILVVLMLALAIWALRRQRLGFQAAGQDTQREARHPAVGTHSAQASPPRY